MKPKSYDIFLDIDFYNATFKGEEKIELAEGTDSIELDSSDIAISTISTDAGKCEWKNDTANHKIVIKGSKFTSVSLTFSGKAVEGGLHGFYKSKYRGGYFLSTQFEPVGARNVFPCVDHPSAKAIFRVSVVTQKELTVICNTPVSSEEVSGEKKKVVFEETPRMSTYLLFFGVGKYVEERIPNGLDVIVASSEEQKGKGRFGIENGRLFLKEYENYYSIPYPLKKLHLIAVPEFAVGAMENWGAITFREVALLVDSSTSVSNKRLIASVIAHEIAHQWFGNLVTMKWWNDLWLNESFATYMSAVIVDRIYPKWEVWPDFLTTETNGAMVGDALHNTHPIEVEVKEPEEINQIFDEISYGKGASVLRMVASFVGEESFRKGVNSYLTAFKYSNAMSRDLWDKLEQSSNEPVAKIMQKWISTKGFPLISVGYENDKVTISQERFLLNGTDRGTRWPVPLHYTINGKEGRMLFEDESTSIVAPGLKQINLNIGQTGFYRVRYDEQLYEIIKGQLRDMPQEEKWGIVTDLFYFVLSERMELSRYLEFVRLLSGDTNYMVVSGISSQLGILREIVPGNKEVSSTFQAFYRKQLEHLGTDGKEGEDENNAVLREKVTTGLAMYDTEFADKFAERFENIFEQAPELRGGIGIAYARSKGGNAFEPLLNKMKTAGSDADAMKAMFGLVSFADPLLVKKTLDLAFTGEVNIGHIVYMVYLAAVNPEGKAELWKWFKENREKLFKTYAGTGTSGAMTETIIARAGIVDRDDVEQYFSQNNIPEADMGIAKGLEMLRAYSRFIEKYGQ